VTARAKRGVFNYRGKGWGGRVRSTVSSSHVRRKPSWLMGAECAIEKQADNFVINHLLCIWLVGYSSCALHNRSWRFHGRKFQSGCNSFSATLRWEPKVVTVIFPKCWYPKIRSCNLFVVAAIEKKEKINSSNRSVAHFFDRHEPNILNPTHLTRSYLVDYTCFLIYSSKTPDFILVGSASSTLGHG
jgi:hypothetical protein